MIEGPRGLNQRVAADNRKDGDAAEQRYNRAERPWVQISAQGKFFDMKSLLKNTFGFSIVSFNSSVMCEGPVCVMNPAVFL